MDIPDTGFCPSSGPEGMHKEPCSQSTRSIKRPVLVKALLNSAAGRLETHLKERMPRNDAKKALKALAPGLDDLVGEAVGEDLAGERGYVDPRRLALEDIAEGLKV